MLQADEEVQLLVWEIEEQIFAAEIKYCLEVQKDVDIIEVPHSKNYISGIVNIRGDIVTIIDLFVLLGKRSSPKLEKSTIILFQYNNRLLAICADNISEVIKIEKKTIENAHLYLGSKELDFISNVSYTEIGFTLILGIEKLFSLY